MNATKEPASDANEAPGESTLDAVIARVREEAQRPEYQVPEPGGLEPLSLKQTPGGAASGEPAADGLTDDGAASRPGTVADFLQLGDDQAFIEAAYQRLFGRPADPVGLRDYGERLRQGYGRPFVLAALAAAPEAGPRRLPGLGLAPLYYKAWQLTRRIGLEWLGFACNRAYAMWRQGRLLAAPEWLPMRLQAAQTERERTVALDRERREAAAAQDARLQGLAEAQAALEAALAAAESQQQAQAAQQGEQAAQQATLARDLRILHASLHALRAQTTKQANPGTVPSMPAALSELSPESDPALAARLDAYYMAFEDTHRGSAAELRAGQAVYLDALSPLPPKLLALPILDLGCGRGEWLELLREHGFSGRGADTSAAMVDHCRQRGLAVEQADAVAALAACSDGSLAAVSAFHLIEHLPFPVLFRLLEEATRALAPGGVLILETPNPESVLVGSHTFYHDFSHRNPVTPSALDFLLGYLGLVERETLRLNPYPPTARIDEPTLAAERLNGHLYGPQDLGMVARKPEDSGSSGGFT